MKTPSSKSATAPIYDPLDWARHTGEAQPLLREIKRQLQTRRRRRVKSAVTTAAVCSLVGVLLWWVPLVRDTATVSTPVARRQVLALADGSKAELNAQTDVRTDFRYGRRTVRIERGEAFFSVAKDPSHPFLVETAHGTVRVIGTQFNVRLAADGFPEVTLLEGAVTFEPSVADARRLAPSDQSATADPSTSHSPLSTRSLRLTPSQQLAFAGAAPATRTLAPSELENITAWREGRLVLAGLTLGEAAAKISAYHGRRITVASAVAGFQMGGVCPLDDFAGFVAALPEAVAVKIVHRGDGSVAVLPR